MKRILLNIVKGFITGFLCSLVVMSFGHMVFSRNRMIETLLNPHIYIAHSLAGVLGAFLGVVFGVIRENKERYQQRLREQEERFTAFIHHSAYGYFETDLQGTITAANSATLEISGLTLEEIKGKNFRDFLHSEDVERGMADFGKIFTEPNAGPRRHRMRAKGGTVKFIEVNALPLVENGKVVGTQGTLLDVSDTQEAEHEIQQKEERFRKLFEHSNDAILLYDLDGEIIDGNRQACEMLGYSLENLRKLSVDRLYSESEAETAETSTEQTKREKSVQFESKFRTAAGKVIDVDISSKLFDSSGGIVQGIVRDITERKKAERALQESEERYRALVETSPDAIVMTDLEGRLTYVSPRLLLMYGADSAEDILGTHVSEYVSPDSPSDPAEVVMRTLEQGSVKDAEFVLLRKDGSAYPAEIRSALIRGVAREPQAMMAIISDVSERKKSEAERRSLMARLHRAEKMEALGALAGGVAHDLNNILWGIVSYPDLLLLDLPEDDPLRKPIETMQQSGQKAVAVVQDLLTLARNGVIEKHAVDLNSVIKEYTESPEHVEFIKEYHDVEVVLKPGADIQPINGSEVHLSKVLMNLVFNSVEAIRNSGSVFIETEYRELKDNHKGYENIPAGRYSILRVSDTGTGIHKDDLDRVFEPFYTNKIMARSGTGLGMSVVWGTVKDHGGFLDIRSVVDEGTVCECYFPVCADSVPETRESDEYSEDDNGSGQVILVVDDLPEQREIISLMLTNSGYSVYTAATGEQAVEFIKENSVDLVILDMIMEPGIDGLETYRRILEISPDQKAIIGSGFYESERVREAQKLGAGTCLKKPYRLRDLRKAVKAELQRGV